MATKPARRSRPQGRVTPFPRESKSRKRSPSEPLQPSKAAPFDVLLKKLAPFLDELSESEIAQIPTAAEASPTRGMFRAPKPPEPVEVVLVRVERKVVGALLLRRKWMEDSFSDSCNVEIQQTSKWPDIMAGDLETWLRFLPADVGSWLSRQAEYLPMRLHDEVFSYENPESILELLEDLTQQEVGEALGVPLVMDVLQHFMQNGAPQQQRRVKTILSRWSPKGHGAPSKQPHERRDSAVALRVEHAKARLSEGVNLIRDRRKRGGYHRDSPETQRELRRLGYSEMEVQAILRARVTNDSSGAAYHFVAAQDDTTPTIVRSMTSRGRKYLASVRP